MTWSSFIRAPAPAQHAVQVYDEPDELAASVARFLDKGFRSGAPAIVIATADHWRRFERELEDREWDLRRLAQEGLIAYRDAGKTLDSIMEHELPSPTAFERVVGGLVDDVASRCPGQTIRAVGEMVDILWHDGRKRAAVALEELWNDLARTRCFALLCAYSLDIFDLDVQANALPDVFEAHTHVRTAADNGTLSAALEEALAEVADPIEAARIYLDVAERVPRDKVPHAQAVLGWLSATGNTAAAEILERTRDHYMRLRAAENPA